MQKWNTCYTTCNGGAKTYSSGSNAGTFLSYASTCLTYKDRVDTLLQASNDSTNAATAGQKCDDNASSSPSSGSGGDNSKDKDAQKDQQKNAECTANPSAEGCANQATQYAAAQKGTAGFVDGNATKGSADVTDTSAVQTDPGAALAAQDGSGGGGGTKNGTVPNNTGGGIPGSGGSPSMGSGGGFAGALGTVASKIADIEKGFFGGGGGSTAAPNADTQTGTPDAPPTASEESPRAPASIKNTDLRRYLPGGDLAPLPPTVTEPNQIQPSTVNLFSRISSRIRELCDKGELYDCI